MALLMQILGIILIVAGVVQLLQGQLIFGIVLIVVGILLGPGGFYAPRWRRRTW